MYNGCDNLTLLAFISHLFLNHMLFHNFEIQIRLILHKGKIRHTLKEVWNTNHSLNANTKRFNNSMGSLVIYWVETLLFYPSKYTQVIWKSSCSNQSHGPWRSKQMIVYMDINLVARSFERSKSYRIY